MPSAEQYLKPEVIRQIKRLDLRAQFIVKGFLHGLHASPFHGFSVEFSEHRKYTPGDDPKDIDWLIYAKTDKYYVKKFEAETNITGYVMMDLSRSMGYTYRQELTKFEYSICLAAALCYLMIHQQDPVGLITFDTKIRSCLRPQTRRSHLGDMLSLLANLKPEGETDIAQSIVQVAAMLRHASLIMIFSDLLTEPDAGARGLVSLAARRARRDPLPRAGRGRGAVSFPRHGRVGRAREPSPLVAGCRRLPPGLSRRGRVLSGLVSPRVFAGPHRLRAAGHQHAIRSGLDGVFVESRVAGVAERRTTEFSTERL